MIHPPTDAMRVPFDGSFSVNEYASVPGESEGKKALQKRLIKQNEKKIVLLGLRVLFFRLVLFSEEFVFTETGDGD